MKIMRHKAVTLIELLVVIAVIGMLVSIVLVSFKDTTDKARLAKAKDFYAQVSHALGAEAVGIWKFEEQTGIIAKDTSGYGNDGTLQNGPSWTSASDCGLGFGRCLDFAGNGAAIIVTDKPGIDFSQSFTITAWVNLDRFGDPSASSCGDKRAMIVRKGANSPGTVEFGTRGAGSDDFNFLVRTSALSWVSRGFGKAPLNKWHHISLSYDGNSNTIKAYLNGEITWSENVGALATSTGNISIGGGTPNCSSSFTDGRIDEVGIYQQALTFSQIQYLYAQGLPRHP